MLDIRVDSAIATVTLDRPDVRNAFNDELIGALANAFGELGGRADVRCIVLAGNGPAFCAGGDLNWMQRMATFSRHDNLRDAGALADMLHTLFACPKPTIARVHGDAYAGGMGLVAACDVAVASLSATFCLSETKLGLIPATIGPYVARAIGNHARRYFLTAEKFDASEAFRIGLVHEIAAPDELDTKVNAILGSLMATSDHAVREAKRLVRDLSGRPLDDALVADTAERIAQIRASDDGKEGIASFLGKRKPRWLAQFEAEQAALAEPEDDPQGGA